MASDFSTKVNTGINNFLSDVGTGFVSNITSGKSIFALPSFNDTSATPTTTPTPPVSTPNSVVSSNTTNPKTQNGKDIIANTDQAKTQKDALDATTQSTDQYMRGNTNIKNPNYVPTPPPPPPPPPVITPEDTAVGNQLFYNSITGKQEKIDTSQTPIPPKTVTSQSEGSNGVITKVYSDGSSDVFQSDGKTLISSNPATQTISTPPTGYQTTDPQSGLIPAGDVNGMNNETYHTYQDGHYGVTDGNGNYHSVTSDTYNTAKTANAANKSLTDAINGILTPEQQTRLNGLLATQQADMKTLLSTNTAITGSATVWGARNAQGVSSSAGDIQKTILDGADRVQKLQTEQAAAVDAMRQSFKHDDVEALNAALKAYDSGVKAISDNIKSTTTEVQKQQDRLTNDNSSINVAEAKKNWDIDLVKYPNGITPNMTAAEREDALQTSPKYKLSIAAQKVMTPEENSFYGDLLSTGAGKYLSLPGGRSASGIQMNIPIIQAMIKKAMAAGLTGTQFGEALYDKTAAGHALTIMTSQGANLAAQADKVTKDINQLQGLADKVNIIEFQSNIPLIQKFLQGINVNLDTNSSYAPFAALLKTIWTNYARVINSQTGSAGTTVNINEEMQHLLPEGSTPTAVMNYLKNTAIKEMSNTTSSYEDTQKELSNQIGNSIGDLTYGTSSSNLSTSPTSGTNNSTTITTPTGGTATYKGGGAF